MKNLIIYKSELEDGIADKIKASSKVLINSPIQFSDEKTQARIVLPPKPKSVVGAEEDSGLKFLESIMVSSGWNLNDDIFLKEELWLARNTVANKPLNLNHIENDIVGHMISAKPVDKDLVEIDEDSVKSVEDLPELFHILDRCVIYTKWTDKDREKMISEVIEEIKQNLWSVSMEAWFNNFDYCLMNQEGCRIVQRNESTAFLSKYLRWYGGTGQYLDSKIGRVLRNIEFCGKGIVRTPANPYSVFVNVSANMVYDNLNKTESKVMDIEKLKLELEEKEKALQAKSAELEKIKADQLKAERAQKFADLFSLDSEKSAALAEKFCEVSGENFEALIVSIKECMAALASSYQSKIETLEKQLAEKEKPISASVSVDKAIVQEIVDAAAKHMLEAVKPIITESFNKGKIPPEAVVVGPKTQATDALENAQADKTQDPVNVKPVDDKSKALSDYYENLAQSKKRK